MASTIHDVARAAGVNPSTVSRAISGKARLTDATKARIHAAMEQLDYHPNHVARSLASGLSGAIGLVVDAQDADAFSNVFFSRSLFAIEKIAQERHYNLIIANGGKHAVQAVEGLVLAKKVDGLILPPSTLSPALLERLTDFPYVVLGQPDIFCPDANWVNNNNAQGAVLAVRHFVARGYRHVAYLGGEEREGFVKQRVQGYRCALPQDARPMVFPAENTAQCAFAAAQALLCGDVPCDAVLCNDNFTAFELLRAAKEAGISVPRALGVITFDNYPLAQYTSPPLTAVDIDTASLGEEAARLLFQHIARPESTRQQLLLGASLILRRSTEREP